MLLWHNGPHHRSAAVGRRDAAQPTTQGRSLLLLELVLVLVVHGEGRSGGASVGVGVVGCRCRLVVHQAVEGSLLLRLLLVVLKVAGWIELLHVLLRMMRLLWMVIHLLVVLVRQFHFNAAATRGLMVMHRMVIRRRPSDLLTATE